MLTATVSGQQAPRRSATTTRPCSPTASGACTTARARTRPSSRRRRLARPVAASIRCHRAARCGRRSQRVADGRWVGRHMGDEGRRAAHGQGDAAHQIAVHRRAAARRVRDAVRGERRQPGARQQRRVPARPLRDPGARQLSQHHVSRWPGRVDVRAVSAARERRARAGRVAGLRHHFHGAALRRRRDSSRSLPSSPCCTTASSCTTRRRSGARRAIAASCPTRRRWRGDRSRCRTTEIPSAIAISGFAR